MLPTAPCIPRGESPISSKYLVPRAAMSGDTVYCGERAPLGPKSAGSDTKLKAFRLPIPAYGFGSTFDAAGFLGGTTNCSPEKTVVVAGVAPGVSPLTAAVFSLRA